MLYTYHVDVGRMLAFDMDLAMKRVRDLKKEIEKTCSIPYVNLVLFVSGGQIMDGRRIVGSYQAGTDNNPIWLVDNRTYNQNQAPKAFIPPIPDDHLQGYLENSMNLPSTYETIVTRAQLSVSFHEISREELKICEILVKDQHFQHQGWAALKCTLEDKGIALDRNKNRFLKLYNQFLAERKEALVHLKEYEKTNNLIRKIPIPKCLDHYAKKCADRLMRESTTVSTTQERKISNFVSCVDKLEKSEFTSSSSSGPPSGKFSEGGALLEEEPVSSADMGKRRLVGELPPLEEVEGNGAAGHQTVSSPVQIRKLTMSTAPSRQLSSDSERGRVALVTGGFTSPGAQSPQSNPGTPKRLSYTEDTGDTRRLGGQSTAGLSAQERAIRFEISPSTSVTSQGSLPGSRSDSPAPGVRRTLSDWIRGNDSRDPIESVKKELEEKFERLTPKLSEELVVKCEEVQKSLDNKSMKEFKGLDRRLAGLEQLMMQMREIVRHQSDMAQGFIQNQQRAKSERDPSILPDLCGSHRRQLEVMLENHHKVCDILRRIRNAKQELCTVMHARIRWIMHMEERLREVDNEVVMTQGMVSRMFSYMKTIRQVHETPVLFAEAIIEGFRRRRFAMRFMEWAGSWAEENSSLYQKEIDRRNEFNQHLSGHFLLRMFTGYGETPPEFATKVPDPFDTELPNITLEDIENLKREVPEIAHLLVIPEDPDLGKKTSTNTLRATSSTSVLLGRDLPPPSTTDQATSYSMTSSDFHLTSAFTDDIVVLNANGETGVITPSPEHKPKKARESGEEEGHAELMQSVEVISEEDGLEIDAALKEQQEIGGGPESESAQYMAYRKSPDIKSLSVQEPKSFEEVEGDLAFHSMRSLSLDEAQFTGKTLKSPLSGTSPDLDDYATADFYIDESIPSAMSISSPDKTIADLHLQLEEKSTALVEKEAEVRQLQADNGTYREKSELLHSTLSQLKKAIHSIVESSSVTQLRLELENIKKQTQEDVETVKCDMTQLSQHITVLVQRLSESNENLKKECDVLVNEAQEETKQVQAQLETCTQVVKEECQQKLKSVKEEVEQEKQNCEKTVGLLKEQLELKEKELETHMQQKEVEVKALVQERDRLKEDMQGAEQQNVELETRLSLEKELLQTGENRLNLVEQELNKVKDNLGALNDNKETLLQDLQDAKQMHEKEVESLKEDFHRQLQTEMERLKAAESDVESYRKLLEDKSAMLESKSCEVDEVRVMHKEKLDECVREWEEKCRVAAEKSEAELQETRTELTLEHEVEMEKVKSDLLLEVAEKEQALDSLQEQLDRLNQQMEQLRQEKDTEIQQTHEQFQTEKEEMLKILDKEHREKLEQNVQELTERLALEEKQRQESALKEKEEELRHIFELEGQKMVKTAVEEKESEVRSLLEDEYLLTLKDSLEKQEVELNRKFEEQEKEKIQTKEHEWQEKLKSVESREVELRQAMEREHEQRTREQVEETERTVRQVLAEEEQLRMNSALEQKEAEVRSALESAEKERLIAAVEAKEKEVRSEMEEDHRKKLQQETGECEEKLKTLEAEYQEKMEALKKEHDKDLEEQYLQSDGRLEEMRREHSDKTQREHEQLQSSHTEILAALESEKEHELKEQKDSLAIEFHKRITELQAELDKKESELEELRGVLASKQEGANKAVHELEAQHEEKLKSLSMKLQQEKTERLEQMKTSLTAEKQVLFNEALNKVVSAKDKVIEDLRRQLGVLQQELVSLKLDRERSQSADQQQTGQDVTRPAEEALKTGPPVMWSSVMSQSVMSQSVVPISESGSLQDRIHQLELELKSKDKEIMKLKSKLEDKMGELSISQDTQNLLKDKISITSCSKGDIVLLCLDEKYDHYVVFTVGATLHFLHSDCLDTLSLRPAPGEPRKLWVLAEIVEKEYCQAKKAHNRFKVPMGTKFYRVRCKPWTHPSLTASTMQPPQRSQSRESTPHTEKLHETPPNIVQEKQETFTPSQPLETPTKTDQSEARAPVTDQSEARAPVTDQSEARAHVTDQSEEDTSLNEKEQGLSSSFSGTEL